MDDAEVTWVTDGTEGANALDLPSGEIIIGKGNPLSTSMGEGLDVKSPNNVITKYGAHPGENEA